MKRILYIEPNFTTKSPSMKSVVRAFPHVVENFDEVEVWAVECEVDHPKLNWQRMWAPKIWPLRLLWCMVAVHLRALWRFGILGQARPDIIQCTDYFAFFADIVYVHFHYARFKEIIDSKPSVILLSFSKNVLFIVSRILERACFYWAKPDIWMTVSDSMAKRLETEEGLTPIKVLPNAYNPHRFNPDVRLNHRCQMRNDLGILEDDIVIGFSALGNLQRKGLPLLLAAAEILRQQNLAIKLLLVGPSAKQLSAEILWEESGYPMNQIIATGHVTETEKYFAAMDAFVFPSHCESFCLVLMEAAALGIPIFPTPFDGHEMTLVEGVNGALIPWNAEGIASVILRSLPMILEKSESVVLAKGVTDQMFHRQLLAVYQNILEQRSTT